VSARETKSSNQQHHSIIIHFALRPLLSALQAQGTGQALVESARALSELVSVQANVLDGLAAVKGARQLLGLCLQVGT
jgi:NAD(P)H-dependent FMN reductase